MCASKIVPKLLLVLMAFFTLTCVVPRIAWGKIVHIAPHGSDATGDGSAANPYHSLNKAQRDVVPGDFIYVHEGTYTTTDPYWGVIDNLLGERDGWITITGAPGQGIPVLDGIGLRATTQYRPAGTVQKYYRIQNLEIRNTPMHAMNIDEGGEYRRQYPSHNVEISNITIVGSNYGGIKMAGIDSFLIRNVVARDFTNAHYPGIPIDMVGCHDGIIEKCTFTNVGWRSGGGWMTSAFMIKGASRDVIVRDCYVENVYAACLIGQTTDYDYYRPPWGELDADGDIVNYDAKRISYYSNVIVNAGIPVAFSNSIGGKFYNNTIYSPVSNVQSGSAPDYAFYYSVQLRTFRTDTYYGQMPVRDQYGEVKNNVFVFGRPYGWNPRDYIVWCQNTHNLFSTFVFENNLWFCLADPDWSEPNWSGITHRDGMPTINDNIYGLDPLWVNTAQRNFMLGDGSPAIHVGQNLYPFVPDDFNDNPYNYGAPSLGAYEHSANGENPSPLSAPAINILPAP